MEQTMSGMTSTSEVVMEPRYRIAGEAGFFEKRQVRDMIRYGSLTVDREICAEGKDDWRRADSFPELQRYFSLAATSPGSTPVPQTPTTDLQVREEINLFGAVLFGGIAMVMGAGIWAGITIATEYQIGFMALGVAFLVGTAVRIGGGEGSPALGLVGAILSLGGCLLGNVLSACYFVAVEEGVSFMEVIGIMTPSIAVELIGAMFSPIDLLFWGIALWEGFSLAAGRSRG